MQNAQTAAALAAIAADTLRHVPGEGMHDTAVPGLMLIRADAPTQPIHSLYRPALCVLAQGAKEVGLGAQRYVYDAAHCLVVSVDLPIRGQVTQASADAPYLCLCIDLDPALLAELAMEMQAGAAPAAEEDTDNPALFVSETTPELADACLRLLRLLDRPGERAAMAPLILREIHYRVLTGEQGAVARRIAAGQGRLAPVQRAIAVLKAQFRGAVSVAALADAAGMSASAFHRHFKTVTGLTPLQYRNRLRLQEARQAMLARGEDAASAGFAVGYDSPSQFSRDYVRLFGTPPARDVARLRASGAMLAA